MLSFAFRASHLKIELSKEARADAITSIQRYFQENMPEPIGNMAAGLLLNYFVEEVGPAIYNQAARMRRPEYSNASQILKTNYMPLSFSIGPTSTASGRSKVEWFIGVPVCTRFGQADAGGKLPSRSSVLQC